MPRCERHKWEGIEGRECPDCDALRKAGLIRLKEEVRAAKAGDSWVFAELLNDADEIRDGKVVRVREPISPAVNPVTKPLASPRPYRFDLIPPRPLLALAKVVHEGEKTHPGSDSWRLLPVDFHLGRAMAHIQLYRAGDRSVDHLAHALTRTIFALELASPTEPSE